MRPYSSKKKRKTQKDTRISVASSVILLLAGIVVGRLFFLMVLKHDFYTALAAGSHEVYAELIAERGIIYMQDRRTKEAYPVAMNRDYYMVYLDNRAITTDEMRQQVTSTLITALEIPEEEQPSLSQKIKKEGDPYEPVADKVPQEIVDQLKEKELPGVGFIRRLYRFYPEKSFAGAVLGFVGKNTEGGAIGQYGIEGYYNELLTGTGGFFSGNKSESGLWIPGADTSGEPAEDGADIYTTIDRQVQYYACNRLQAAMREYGASRAALVIMDPNTGAIIAMCSEPSFDPNTYNMVNSVQVYNNDTIFTPYEVGSVFKPLVMAAALNEELVTPSSYFYDKGSVDANCSKPIRNADLKVYEDQTMTGVLEYSINTGMVYVAKLLGKQRLITYLEEMGFGIKTGIGLATEAAGTIQTLYVNGGNDIDCYAATASFGQGFTATPIQMVTAFSSIANGGVQVRPYIVEKIVYPSGKIDRTKIDTRPAIFTKKTASFVGGMMVNVVDKGHAGGAAIPGYYIAGKTGTAQIPGVGGYTNETNHTFIGYAPVENPAFVMLVKFEKPQRRFSSQTAAPVFGDISKWLLDYFAIPPSR